MYSFCIFVIVLIISEYEHLYNIGPVMSTSSKHFDSCGYKISFKGMEEEGNFYSNCYTHVK